MIFYVFCIAILWVQTFAGELVGDVALLLRLWLLPVVCLALSSSQIRPFFVIILGLLVDGLLATPTGLHSLELCLVYAFLGRFSEHLGYQTILGRIILGCTIAVVDTLVITMLSWGLPFEHEGVYLPAHFFMFALIQIGITVCCLPSVIRLTANTQSADHRL